MWSMENFLMIAVFYVFDSCSLAEVMRDCTVCLEIETKNQKGSYPFPFSLFVCLLACR